MNIIGIDPSIKETGVAWLIDGKLGGYHTAKVNPKLFLCQRIYQMGLEVTACIPEGMDFVGVIERADGFSYNRSKNNQKSLHILQMATGGIIHACGQFGIELADFTPDQWKGKTPKDVIINNVNLEYSTNFALSTLNKKGKRVESPDSHMAEAIALATWYDRLLKRERMMS